MPQMCCVPTCRSLARKDSGTSFFNFPNDCTLRARWAEAIKLGYHPEKGNRIRVCSRHFKPSDLIFGGNVRRLKKIAVPSNFLPMLPAKIVTNTASTSDSMLTNRQQSPPNKIVVITQGTLKRFTILPGEVLQTKINTEMSRTEDRIQSSNTTIESTFQPEIVPNEIKEATRNSPTLKHQLTNRQQSPPNKIVVINEGTPKRFTMLPEEVLQTKINTEMSWTEDCIESSNTTILQPEVAQNKIEEASRNTPTLKNFLDFHQQENESNESAIDDDQFESKSVKLEFDISDVNVPTDNERSMTRTINILEKEVQHLIKENCRLTELAASKPIFTLNRFAKDDGKIFFYTGFQKFEILKGIFRFVLPSGDTKDLVRLFNSTSREQDKIHSIGSPLPPQDQFFLALIRLRRGMSLETLGDLFGISTETAEKLFLVWLNLLYLRLGSLNTWSDRDKLMNGASVSLQEKYPNVIGRINCTEFLVQKPPARQSEPNYEGTTVKSLIMTSPNGAIIYASPLFSGSISDQAILKESGFVDILKEKVENGKIHRGDTILANKAFNVVDIFSGINLELDIPVFRINGSQCTSEQVEIYGMLANERLNVERAIERLKTYEILSVKMPVANLDTRGQIYHVCCWLTNFRFPQRK